MQMRKLFVAAVVSTGALLASSTAALAAAWTTPSGSTSTFKYDTGHDSNGLFGSPTQVTSSGFFFQPTNFIAQSANNSAQLTTDTLSVNVSSLNGTDKTITAVKLGEIGDYSIDNGGGVKAQGALFVQVKDPVWNFATRVYYAELVTTPGFPLNGTDANGIWTGTLVVNLPAAAANISIVMNNTLQAHSNVGGSAFIQKKFLGDPGSTNPGVTIVTGIAPEPVTMAAMLGGFGIIAARRRKA